MLSAEEGGLQPSAVSEVGDAEEARSTREAAEAPQLTLAEWKSQQVKKKAQSTRERLRDEYARQAAQLQIGDRCEIGGHKGEIAFLGDGIEGLPGGFWVGIRYDEPVGKVRWTSCEPRLLIFVFLPRSTD
jgi:tubulin-folding cofactor B